jgi:hypothetical protein
MKCEVCGINLSDKIYNIHILQCKPVDKIEVKEEVKVEQPKNKGGRPRK